MFNRRHAFVEGEETALMRNGAASNGTLYVASVDTGEKATMLLASVWRREVLEASMLPSNL
jgi:hypothetical protein